jgi:LacI family transcriptional regulator, galactose operon repressor
LSQRGEGDDSNGPATIRQIALRTGVSVATVSRVLNGRPDVAAATREVVMKAIRERDYVTNRSARGLAGGRTGFIGLTVPFFHADYFMQMVSGAATALYERDARFVMCPTEHEHDREVSVLERLMHGTTDGAVLVLPSESSEELARLQRRQYPFVVMDPLERLHDGIPVVTAAHWSGARAVTEYLISLGHRRIGVITGPTNGVATVDRLGGYHAGLLAAGLPAPSNLIVNGDFQVESGAPGVAKLLSLSEPPSAIFAFNDNMAVGALDELRARGLRVPEDVSLVGFDDTQISSVTLPKLTTVRQPLQEMGRVAADILFRLIEGQPLEVSRIELSTRLVIRGSTAPPANRKDT